MNADQQVVRTSRNGDVLTIVLCDLATRNAQTPAVWRELERIGRELDPSIRVVLLRAEGPDFSSGLHHDFLTGTAPEGLGALVALDDPQLEARIESFQAAFRWWRESPAITISVVSGAAVGAGFQLALATDLRVVTEDARFAMREVNLGLVPDLGGTGRLLELVGYPKALEICGTGRWIESGEAESLGVADYRTAVLDLATVVANLVNSFLEPAADAVVAVKQLLRAVAARPLTGSFALERQAQLSRLRRFGKA